MKYQKSNSSLKSIIAILFVLLIVFSYVQVVYGVVKPTPDFYVNDYVGLLSNETKEHIMQKSLNLQSKAGAQIVIVTVKNLEGKSIEDYSLELARSFGIGDEEKNNGLLLLLALEEREFRVEVGYGLEGILPDAKTGRFQDDYIIPYFRNNEWDQGILNGFNAFYKEICTEYGIEDNDIIVENKGENVAGSIISTIIMIIFVIIILFSRGGRGRRSLMDTCWSWSWWIFGRPFFWQNRWIFWWRWLIWRRSEVQGDFERQMN